MAQTERMRTGEFYNSRDPELLAGAHRARKLLAEFVATPSTDVERRHEILTQLFAAVGEGVWIEPPFFCDYGKNIHIGAQSFVNVNCVMLDSAEIRIGANALIGPGVQLLTASHPLRAADRIVPPESRKAGESPYRTQAQPIRIGDNAWIGAGSLVLPGVTIGDNVTIGAGSIVSSDI